MKKNSVLFVVFTFVLAACHSDVTREGDRLFNEGQYDGAIRAYTEYLSTKPKNVKSLYNRGRAYEELGQTEKARADFIRVLDISPENLNANMSMGKYWYNKKGYDQAINFFDKVIQVDGRTSDAYMFKGRAFHKKGEFEEAIKSYNLAIEFDRRNGDAFLYRGALKVAMKQHRAACNDFTRARALGADEAGTALTKYCK